MQTYYLFQSGSAPDLCCFTDEASGSKLPAEDGPWALVRKIDPEDEMPHDVSRKSLPLQSVKTVFSSRVKAI